MKFSIIFIDILIRIIFKTKLENFPFTNELAFFCISKCVWIIFLLVFQIKHNISLFLNNVYYIFLPSL